MMRAQLVGEVWFGVPCQQIIELAAVARIHVNRLTKMVWGPVLKIAIVKRLPC
jgi:hypothetical protein